MTNLIGFSHRLKIRAADSIEELDAIVDNLTAMCGVPPRDKECEPFASVARRVRSISPVAADHIEVAHERRAKLEAP